MPGETPFASFGGMPIVSCGTTIQQFQEAGLDVSAFARRANSYRCSLGAEPGEAWILMQAKDLRDCGSALPKDLIIGIGNRSVTIKSLAILSSQRLFPSNSQDPDGLHLVQAVDVRWLLKRRTINKRYNLRKYCTESDWITGTLKVQLPETPWTFSQICEDIWGQFSAFGVFFGFSTWNAGNILGDLPTDNPENLRFEGISAWDALASLCQQFGFYLRYNPFTAEIKIIKIGYSPDPNPGSDGEFANGFGGAKGLLASPADQLEFPATPGPTVRQGNDDALTEDTETFIGVPYIPATVEVVFQNNGAGCSDISAINSSYGRGWHYSVERTAASLHQSMSDPLFGPTYSFLENQVSGTKITLYSTTYARFNSATATTPVNLTDLQSIARRMAIDYYRTAGLHSAARIVFGGIKLYIPGPTICEVTWREWGDGLKTEVARMPIPVGLPKIPKVFAEGSAGERVHFQIQSYDSGTGIANCMVTHRPCGAGTVADEYSGTIEVQDPAGCYFNEDEADLIGRNGHADYVYDVSDPYETCFWAVSGLCCP